jgi:hypothetical protein
MTFTPGIPASGQSLGASRTQVLNNFSNYYNVVSQDHIAPNLVGEGKHNKSTYPIHVPTTDPTTAANEVAVYCKLLGAVPALFMRPENNGTPINCTPFLTTSNILIGGNPFLQYSLTLGAARVTWGSATQAGGFPSGTVVPFAIPFTGAPQSIQLTIESPSPAARRFAQVLSTPNNNNFTLTTSDLNGVATNVSFTYLAFGLV